MSINKNNDENPSKWPSIVSGVWYQAIKALSKTAWAVWITNVLISSTTGTVNRIVEWLNPLNLEEYISEITKSINLILTISETKSVPLNVLGSIKPMVDSIKNVADNLTPLLSLEFPDQTIDTLIALASTGWIYIWLVPFLLQLAIYQDKPNINQKLRSFLCKSKKS